MKPILKYIALLILAGLIIPLYRYTGAAKSAPVISTAKVSLIDNSFKRDGAHRFSILRDAATKLLPVLKFF